MENRRSFFRQAAGAIVGVAAAPLASEKVVASGLQVRAGITSVDAIAKIYLDGSVSDLWGEKWTAEDVAKSGFGVSFPCKIPAGAQIDGIRIDIQTK